MIADELSLQIMEAEQEFAEVLAHQNHCKFSNVKISIIYEFLVVYTSSILVPITTTTNLTNESPTTNTLETIELENTITTE